MVFGSIAAHDKDTITVLDVDPVVGHRTASERLCQSRNSGAVSDTCLVLYVHQAERAEKGLIKPALFVIQGCRTN